MGEGLNLWITSLMKVAKQICCAYHSIITLEDLEEIVSDFEFNEKRDGQIRGFCTWFEVEFYLFSEDIEMV